MKRKLLSVSLAASMMVTPAFSAVYAETLEPQNEEAVQDTQTDETVVPADQTTEPAEGETTTTEPAEETEQPKEEIPADETETPAEGTETPAETEAPAEEAKEETTEETPAESAAEETKEAEEEAPAAEADDAVDPQRDGTEVGCSLTLDTKADGVVTDTLMYQSSKDQYDVQVGGTLNLSNVWRNYSTFKTLYVLKNGSAAFRAKNLVGSFTYVFYVNPEVVSVNTDILESPEAWQTAFETGSGEKAAGFFTFMKCTAASYDPSTGAVSVTFTIDENGTNMVSVKTLEDVAGARPQDIDAYSPEGAFYIKKADFKKGAVAVPGNASFNGNMDMSPWMALVFPIHFEADTQAAPLKLEVPDGTITFAVENGTWEDGTTDPKTVVIPMDVVETPDGYQAAGTLEDYMVPAGMKAAEGYDQATGKWVPELNTTENGIILTDGDGASASYTYVFEKKAEEPKPDQPKPDQPKPDQPKPDQPKPDQPKPDQPKPNKPSKPAQKPTVNKPNSVQTDAFTGLAAFMGLNGISAAGLWAALKRKKK